MYHQLSCRVRQNLSEPLTSNQEVFGSVFQLSPSKFPLYMHTALLLELLVLNIYYHYLTCNLLCKSWCARCQLFLSIVTLITKYELVIPASASCGLYFVTTLMGY